ncbi:sensor histidine kinase [Lolliginicoccus levis]|uniref:sensor histidine kinase n=1 Tax=Lolliginicoccus levis TaxID=2919542 RepID=UPI00241DE910|nr:histidine kinase [Lolliginicoccus levis]
MSSTIEPGREEPSDNGWIFGAAWLVFLVFPAMLIVEDNTSLSARAAALALLAAYAILYTAGLFLLRDIAEDSARINILVAALIAIIVAVAAIAGIGAALAMLPFVTCYVIFAWPLARSLALIAITAATIIWTPVLIDGTPAGAYWEILLFTAPAVVISLMWRTLLLAEDHRRHLEREVARLGERDRIAREVHDILGHGLTVIAVKAELASRLIDADTNRARSEIDAVHELSRTALAEVRAAVSGLRTRGLPEALSSAEQALDAAGIDWQTEMAASPDRADIAEVFACAVREGTTNIIRHSDARACCIHIEQRSLRITNDGAAAGPVGTVRLGNGLRGLEERATAAGGRIAAGTTATGEFVLEVEIP